MIDISGWSNFDCRELFECKNTGNILARDVIDGSGDTPYVTASGYNNGVAAHIDASNYEIIKGHCILVGGKTFTITYQEDDFVSNDSHNFTIRVKNYNVSNKTYLYLATIIYRYFGQKYSWNDAVTKDKLMDERLPLPVTSDGQPDWDYMESYMRAVMEESEKGLENLKKADDTKHLIDVSGWGKFDITELFDMSLPKGDLQVKKVDDGDVPLITPSNFNNGMLQRISKHSPSTLYDKGSLTVDMFGNAYYQEEDFFVTAHGHVNVLLPKMPLNVYTGTFLASTIRTMFFDKYGFNEMCTQKVLKAESIWLPITPTGEPDYQYMENYMQEIMNKSEQIISNLQIGE